MKCVTAGWALRIQKPELNPVVVCLSLLSGVLNVVGEGPDPPGNL